MLQTDTDVQSHFLAFALSLQPVPESLFHLYLSKASSPFQDLYLLYSLGEHH